MDNHESIYEVAIIGGGTSGAALLYTLAKYSSVKNIVLLEQYPDAGQVNSHARNNSQTLHTGDIETNYTLERAATIKPAASMVTQYCNRLSPTKRDQIMRITPKMLLGVGAHEVSLLKERYHSLRQLFPELQLLHESEIRELEPMVMRGRNPTEPVVALYNPNGQAIDFGKLAQSFIEEAKTAPNKTITTLFSHPVKTITHEKTDLYALETPLKTIHARIVVVDADAHSLGFAKQLGYGQEYSLIPMAGTFFFSPEYLRGKVYTCQDAKLLYTAVHGDPDLTTTGLTRWGPTVRFFPVLERGQYRTIIQYFRSAGLARWATWRGFVTLLRDRDRRHFFIKNLIYEVPILGKYLFARTAQKICPSIKASNLRRAKNYGGMRLQRINVNTQELEVGERKIIGENIIFNMTPSPGASICLHNALIDAEHIIKFFNGTHTLDTERCAKDLRP